MGYSCPIEQFLDIFNSLLKSPSSVPYERAVGKTFFAEIYKDFKNMLCCNLNGLTTTHNTFSYNVV